MLSDVLSEAEQKIRYYQTEFPQVYSGPINDEIDEIVAKIVALREFLDRPPGRPQNVRGIE